MNTGEHSGFPKYDPLCLETVSEFSSPTRDPPLLLTALCASRICFSGRGATWTEGVLKKSGYLLREEKKLLSKRRGGGEWSLEKEQTQRHFNCSQQTHQTQPVCLSASLHAKAAATRGQCDHMNLTQLLAPHPLETGTSNTPMK